MVYFVQEEGVGYVEFSMSALSMTNCRTLWMLMLSELLLLSAFRLHHSCRSPEVEEVWEKYQSGRKVPLYRQIHC